MWELTTYVLSAHINRLMLLLTETGTRNIEIWKSARWWEGMPDLFKIIREICININAKQGCVSLRIYALQLVISHCHLSNTI